METFVKNYFQKQYIETSLTVLICSMEVSLENQKEEGLAAAALQPGAGRTA